MKGASSFLLSFFLWLLCPFVSQTLLMMAMLSVADMACPYIHIQHLTHIKCEMYKATRFYLIRGDTVGSCCRYLLINVSNEMQYNPLL